jgi:hypothetical protein
MLSYRVEISASNTRGMDIEKHLVEFWSAGELSVEVL